MATARTLFGENVRRLQVNIIILREHPKMSESSPFHNQLHILKQSQQSDGEITIVEKNEHKNGYRIVDLLMK